MSNKRQNITLIVLILGLIFLTCLWFDLRVSNVKVNKDLTNIQNRLSVQQEKYSDALEKSEDKFIENYSSNSSNNPNASILAISKQVNSYNILNKANNSFFKVYFKYNDQKEYSQRADKLSYLITDNVKNDGTLFDSGMIDGHSTVKLLHQNVTFSKVQTYITNDDQNSIYGIANVEFKVNDQDCLRIYQVAYDKKLQKFTNINLVQVSGKNSNLQN